MDVSCFFWAIVRLTEQMENYVPVSQIGLHMRNGHNASSLDFIIYFPHVRMCGTIDEELIK